MRHLYPYSCGRGLRCVDQPAGSCVAEAKSAPAMCGRFSFASRADASVET
jgi:hypothetical protein